MLADAACVDKQYALHNSTIIKSISKFKKTYIIRCVYIRCDKVIAEIDLQFFFHCYY